MNTQPQKSFPVSWEQFHRDAKALAWRLSPEKGRYKALICITRGGIVPAAIVARELEIRVIDTVCVASYHDYKDQGDLQVLKHISSDILELGGDGGEDILVIDDLVDTGKTAKCVREMLPKAHFATVYAKPMGSSLIDTYVTAVSQDTWIYFPWDLELQFAPPIVKSPD